MAVCQAVCSRLASSRAVPPGRLTRIYELGGNFCLGRSVGVLPRCFVGNVERCTSWKDLGVCRG